MITYLDTSTLVKLYVDEPGSLQASVLVDASYVIATSRVAYVEAVAAFSRRRSEFESEEVFRKLRLDLDNDWQNYLVIEVNEAIAHLAADLAQKHNLRGFDSLHLASAVFLKNRLPSRPVLFSSADKKLNKAAKLEELKVESG